MLVGFFLFFSFLTGWLGLVVLGIYFFVIAALFEDDWWFKGFLFLALPLAFAYGLGVIGIPDWKVAMYVVGGYLATGIAWSFPRYAILVSDIRKAVEKIKSSSANWTTTPNSQKGDRLRAILFGYGNKGRNLSDFLDADEIQRNLNVMPSVSSIEAKARIFSWVLYWPFSMLNYIYTRLLKDLIDFIVERMKGVYNLIAQQIMRGLEI